MKLDDLIDKLQKEREKLGDGDIRVMIHYEEPDSYLYLDEVKFDDEFEKQVLITALK